MENLTIEWGLLQQWYLFPANNQQKTEGLLKNSKHNMKTSNSLLLLISDIRKEHPH